MSSFTTLVNIDANTGTKLAKFLAATLSKEEADSFLPQIEDAIAGKDTSRAMELYLSKTEVILNLSNDQDCEAAFQSLFSILYILGDEEAAENADVVRSIINKLTQDVSNSRRRLSALLQFFNLAFSSNTKFELLLAIYNFAKETTQLQKISALHEKVSEWISSWKLDESQQQMLFKTIARIFFEVGQKKRALDMTVQFLKALDEALSSDDIETVVKPALVSAINSVSGDFKQRANLFEALGMQRLPGDAMALLTVLRILCDGSVADWKSFVSNSANETILKSHDISVSAIERKIRIFSLTSLAADAVNKTLTFSSISSTLQISEDDVEEWVVEAIAEGVIQASINQLNGTVTIHRFVQRSFGPAQWRSLGGKLENLKQRLQSALDKMTTV